MSGLEAHGIVFQRQHGGRDWIATPPLNFRPSGTVVIASVGRGDNKSFKLPAIAHKDGARLPQLGDMHPYTKYPESGTALYTLARPSIATGQSIGIEMPPADEATLAAVEVAGTRIQDVAWNEARPGKILGRFDVRSNTVTTTGPAMLVAFWWGDAGVNDVKTATPGDGFKLIDAVLDEGALVQCAVAVKQVDQAGTYDVGWTATPRQSAQLWLVAVQ